MKKILNIFVCDECSKQSESSLEEDGYPYWNGFVYLYRFSFKINENDKVNIENLHFCSKECMKKFLIERLDKERWKKEN